MCAALRKSPTVSVVVAVLMAIDASARQSGKRQRANGARARSSSPTRASSPAIVSSGIAEP